MKEFQFHNGSIKSNSAVSRACLRILFQFHNGSIKSKQHQVNFNFKTRFQFHNGSIKRRYGYPFTAISLLSFNSTMVRLKARLRTMLKRKCSSFNSTMVRLKAGNSVSIGGGIEKFQFHNGSIKSKP